MIRKVCQGLLIAALFASCEEPDLISSEVIPGTDQPGVFSSVNSINAFSVTEDSLIGSSNAIPLFLGSLNDQEIGETYASVNIQMRLNNSAPSFTAATVDSVVLTLGYSSVYGDSTAEHHFSVYKMDEAMKTDTFYYTVRSFAYSTLLGSVITTPSLHDSVLIDTVKVAPHLRLKLNNSFGTDLIANSPFNTNDDLQNYIKGLYIRDSVAFTGSGDVKGSIIAFDPASAFNTVTVYYTDTTHKSYSFLLNSTSARNNRIQHSYISSILTDSIAPSTLYIQSLAGMKAKIKFPDLRNVLNVPAGTPISVNKAEIEVKLKSGTTGTISNHSSLIIFGIDSTGRNSIITDIIDQKLDNTSLIIGLDDGGTYRFTVSRPVQKILNGTASNFGFYIVAAGSMSNAQRTLLDATDVKLNLTYTLQNN
jgi:hypothetical protein